MVYRATTRFCIKKRASITLRLAIDSHLYCPPSGRECCLCSSSLLKVQVESALPTHSIIGWLRLSTIRLSVKPLMIPKTQDSRIEVRLRISRENQNQDSDQGDFCVQN